MRSVKIAFVMIVAVAAAQPLFAGEGHKCTASTQDCLDHMAANLSNRGWVGIEAGDDNMRITRVVEGSPAEAAGFAVGDVLTAANGVVYSEANKADLEKVKKGMVPGATITFTLERAGTARDVKVTLAALPDNVRAQWVGNHMLEHADVKVASR